MSSDKEIEMKKGQVVSTDALDALTSKANKSVGGGIPSVMKGKPKSVMTGLGLPNIMPKSKKRVR